MTFVIRHRYPINDRKRFKRRFENIDLDDLVDTFQLNLVQRTCRGRKIYKNNNWVCEPRIKHVGQEDS